MNQRAGGGAISLQKKDVALDSRNGIDFKGYRIESLVVEVTRFREEVREGQLETELAGRFLVNGYYLGRPTDTVFLIMPAIMPAFLPPELGQPPREGAPERNRNISEK